jgi:Fic family protein
MNAARFTTHAAGKLTKTAAGNAAFVPAAAPRELKLSDGAIELLDKASNRLGVLQGIGHRLPNPDLMVGPYLRREAVLSSRIEGTQTTLSDVYAAEADQPGLIASGDVREVQNYLAAHEYGLGRLGNFPLSLRFIRELHERLMRDVRVAARHPGQFRTYQNFVGGATEDSATYVGPPVPEMKRCLDDLDRFMNERSGLRPLIQMAVLHYQFEAIHPFGDGNGRVGRLLMSLFLTERGLMPQPLLYLSAYFERTRSPYYEGLMRVSTHGDWDSWIRYVLEGVRVQAEEAADLADRLLGLQARYREHLQGVHATANSLALVDALFVNPLVTAKRAQIILGVSNPTAHATIRTLEEHGILREVTNRKWNRVFRADEIQTALRGQQT